MAPTTPEARLLGVMVKLIVPMVLRQQHISKIILTLVLNRDVTSTAPTRSAGQPAREGQRPLHIDVAHCCGGRRNLTTWSTECSDDLLGSLRLILEVIGVQHQSRLNLAIATLRLCVLSRFHSVMERLVVLIHPNTRRRNNVSFCSVADLLRSDARLIATEGLHTTTDMKRCWNIFQLNSVNTDPEVLNSCLDHHA